MDDDDEENFSSPPVKRKSSAMAEDHPPPPPLPPTHAARSAGAAPSVAASGPAQASGGEEVSKHIKTPHRRRQQQPQQQVSMHVGEVMSVPLAGKSVPFRVVKRRSKGFNSVVFECREEQEEAMGDEADRPRRVVTVKVGYSSRVDGTLVSGGFKLLSAHAAYGKQCLSPVLATRSIYAFSPRRNRPVCVGISYALPQVVRNPIVMHVPICGIYSSNQAERFVNFHT